MLTMTMPPGNNLPLTAPDLEMAARVRFHGVEAARRELAEAGMMMLVAESPQEKAAAESHFLEKRRELAKAKDWWPGGWPRRPKIPPLAFHMFPASEKPK